MSTLFATCAHGIEAVLASELRALGALDVRPARAGVSFTGDLQVAYTVCLWSRTASRVVMPLGRVDAPDAAALYDGVRAIAWEEHLSPDGTLSVDFQSDANAAFRNTMFGAQKVKDAIVDRLRDLFGRRPSVDSANPDLRINVRVRAGKATVSLDLSGDALHRRGYREAGVQGVAPLKESLAAAMLLLGGWREVAAAGGALVDPMCGSGTLLIEGAWIAGDVAPGSLRPRWGFTGWLGHDAELWDDLLAEADVRAEAGLANLPPIVGYDLDAGAVRLATATIARAGLRGRVTATVRDIGEATPPEGALSGLLAVNPPYGERMGEREAAASTYAVLGQRLRDAFPGWRYAVLSGEDAHAAALAMVPAESHELYNGALPIRLDVGTVPTAAAPDETAGVTAFANRLRKDFKHLGKWAKREAVSAWRVYDADLPDFSLAVDLYECDDGVRRAVLFEYEAPAEIDPVKAKVRLDQAVAVVPGALGMSASELRVKVRRRQKGDAQYERERFTGRSHVVREADARFLVNLDDYLDTGLFLDHRDTRARVAEMAEGRSLLNLFCYTAAVTVRAALAGCARSESVDLSNTYIDWARRNLELNGISAESHTLVRADVFRYLEQAALSDGPRFDVVFLDPPSFSTSKGMEATLDIQRDQIALVTKSAALLAPGGTLVFSTNLRKFHIDDVGLARHDLVVEDISGATIPADFARNPRIHRCYLVTRA